MKLPTAANKATVKRASAALSVGNPRPTHAVTGASIHRVKISTAFAFGVKEI